MAERIQRVMVITAHPDDSEFGAGGTVARLVKEGKQVTYCIVTDGSKGSGDRAMTPDRLVKNPEEEQRVTAAIRRHRPDLIITQNPHRTKNLFASHRDHRITAGLVLDVVYPLARDHMAFPELLAQGLEPHKVKEVHLMWWEDPEVVVDISDTIDLKLEALACHASQLHDMTTVAARVRDRAAHFGR